jgi:hypothetical protein
VLGAARLEGEVKGVVGGRRKWARQWRRGTAPAAAATASARSAHASGSGRRARYGNLTRRRCARALSNGGHGAVGISLAGARSAGRGRGAV